jgi:hypothetical protein
LKKLEMQELNVAIDEQLKRLGRVVMVLIGEVLNNVVTKAPIGHSLFSELELNPSAPVGLAVEDQTIRVRSISDEEAIWDDLEKTYGNQLPADLAQPLASALDHIRRNHYAVLRLPGESALSQPLLDSFVDALRQNLARYKHAWNGCKGQADVDSNEFNDLLRIAYNFASDAVLVIRLLVSICDLKPIVRWCTVDEWFRLAESFVICRGPR